MYSVNPSSQWISGEMKLKFSEDAFRWIVYHANNPESNKCWFDFTEARKEYRQQLGYPDTRPKLAWHEVKN